MPTTPPLFDEYLSARPPSVDAPVEDVADPRVPADPTAAGDPADPADPTTPVAATGPDAAPADALDAVLPPAPPRADDGGAQRSAVTGRDMRGPFLAFWTHYGPTLCGEPLTDEVLIDGRRAQVFERMALEEVAPGRVQPMDIGARWLRSVAEARRGRPDAAVGGLVIADRAAEMAALAVAGGPDGAAKGAYPRRTLADIRYIVVHHTGAAAALGPEAIAREHGQGLGWPGIGYHFVVDADGGVHQTQDLTVTSHHARQFNPVAVGVALCGTFDDAPPPAGQLDRAAALIAHLIDRLGLPLDAVRGHGELVQTDCPGLTFAAHWRSTLHDAVARHAGRTALRSEARAIVPVRAAPGAVEDAGARGAVEGAGAAAP